MIPIQQAMNGMIAILMARFMLNDVPHAAGLYQSPEEKYRLVKRTKRGSLVVITRKENKARIELANQEDSMDITRLLNAAGVQFELGQGISKSAWEGTPAYLREERGPMSVRAGEYPGLTITFDYGELERVMQGGILQPMMLGEAKLSSIDLSEKLPPTPRVRPLPAFYSPAWAALHEDVPRYYYHVPSGKVVCGRPIKAYRIQEPEFADTFGRARSQDEYVWLSSRIIYPANDAYVVDITKLNNDDMRFTGQAEGNLLHKGDIPAGAIVGIKKRFVDEVQPC